MIGSRKSTTRLAVEALESRWVPAGNITALLIADGSGNVTASIVGDNEANEVRVVQDTIGYIRIEGIGSTTINGQAAVELVSSDRFTNVDIQLGGGADRLILEVEGTGSTPTRIDTHSGDDSVTAYWSGALRDLLVESGGGNDDLAVHFELEDGLNLGGSHRLEVDTGTGDDTVTITSNNIVFRRNCIYSIDTGHGSDKVDLQFTGPAFFDLYSQLDISTGGGSDEVTVSFDITRFQASSLSIDTGSGDDTVAVVFNGTVTFDSDSSLVINTSSGDDSVLLNTSATSNLIYRVSIETGDGADTVQLVGDFASGNGSSVLLGDGDDTLIGDPDSVTNPWGMFFDGGSGNDTVLNAGYFDGVSLFDFETLE